MHSWKKKLVVSQLALACTLAITSQANATTNDISGTTYNTFHHYTMRPTLMTFIMMAMIMMAM